MSRPTKLDDLIAKRICDAVAKGLPRRTAAKLAGVAPSSLFLWLKKGRDGHEDYSDFSERVALAEAKGEDELMGYMREHARLSHSACSWLLERRNPAAYALRRPERDAVNPAGDARLAHMSDSELHAEKQKIRERSEDGMTKDELESEIQRIKGRLAGKVVGR